jgi:hypothetical protein
VRRESGPHGAGLYRRPGVGGGARPFGGALPFGARSFGVAAVPAVPAPERTVVVDQAAEDDAMEW